MNLTVNRERNHRPGRIFTYIDSDAYEFYDEASFKPDQLSIFEPAVADF